MHSSPEAYRLWAQQLLAAETQNHSASDPRVHETVRVCEKLRISLTKFVGPNGFVALLRRALALARAEHPLLDNVKVTTEGRLARVDELAADGGQGIEAATAITAHLLTLLVAFIGESLTVRLIHEVWPEARLETDCES